MYPDLEPDEAFARLWAASRTCAASTGTTRGGLARARASLEGVAARLTGRRFDAVRLHGPGTDLTVGLLPSSVWHAADFTTVDGLRHFPNIPSEEIFTTPDPGRADGHVTATRPLEVYGAMIDGIRVEFADGRAVRIEADRGAETLRSLAARDDGASQARRARARRRRGAHRPARDGVLRDAARRERREPHRARQRLRARRRGGRRARVNPSTIHVDFMIGSPELDVDGLTRDGDTVPLLRGGAWKI